jgi:uncharacterized ubiquitin-like protein YukD
MEFFTDSQIDTALSQYAKKKEYARRYYQENKEKLRQKRINKKQSKTINKNACGLSEQQDLQDCVRRDG